MNTPRTLYALSKGIHFWLPVTGFSIFLILMTLANYVNTGLFFSNWHLASLIREGWLILIQVIAALYFVYYAILFFDKKVGIEFSVKRYAYEIACVIVVGFLINRFFLYLFVTLIVVPEPDLRELNQRLHNLLIISQVLVLLIYILLTGFRIIKSLQKKQLEILKLQKAFTQTQFEAIKNQLNPHFLFNSLSVLTSLVYADANKAETFIDKLSGTYRYLLDQREKEAVHISEEITFLENYKYLAEQRFGSKLGIVNDLSPYPPNHYLLPHTFLVVLEYIIGSNSMSASKPLTIEISFKNSFLFFRYVQQIKALQHSQLKEQFASLQNSYRQSGKEITITQDDFLLQQSIRIPLISI
jgi:two-component system, LytTR family, sensor kinase